MDLRQMAMTAHPLIESLPSRHAAVTSLRAKCEPLCLVFDGVGTVSRRSRGSARFHLHTGVRAAHHQRQHTTLIISGASSRACLINRANRENETSRARRRHSGKQSPISKKVRSFGHWVGGQKRMAQGLMARYYHRKSRGFFGGGRRWLGLSTRQRSVVIRRELARRMT
jgi:hypothetical protein